MKHWTAPGEVYQRLREVTPTTLASIKTPRQHMTALGAPGFIHPNGQIWLAQGRLGHPNTIDLRPEDIAKELEEKGISGITLSCDMTLAVMAGRKIIWAHTRLTHQPMVPFRFEGANYALKAVVDRHHADTRALAALIRQELDAKIKKFPNWEFKSLEL